MSKRETIDSIRRFNPSANTEFLAGFEQLDLLAYLHQLQEVERERHAAPQERLAEKMEMALA